jgi:hypothetical protein
MSNMTPEQYRTNWILPADGSMVTPHEEGCRIHPASIASSKQFRFHLSDPVAFDVGSLGRSWISAESLQWPGTSRLLNYVSTIMVPLEYFLMRCPMNTLVAKSPRSMVIADDLKLSPRSGSAKAILWPIEGYRRVPAAMPSGR